MYRKKNTDQLEFENFHLPFGGKLRSDNRWIRLSGQIPWDEIEEEYACIFSDQMGAPAKSFRMALGALIIKERLAITDEETVEQIRETPYLQYFVGLEEFRDEPPFDPSMMVHFRKRITPEMLAKINDAIIDRRLRATTDTGDGDNPPSTSSGGKPEGETKKPNSGIMMIDASVPPADITYPTDLKLLNASREKLEEIIDVLYDPVRGKIVKPRTYRRKARKAYLQVAKLKKPGKRVIRKAIKRQLQYIRRDIGHIERLVRHSGLEPLSKSQHRSLLVIREIYRQQRDMFARESHSVADRIVSISQPHVRPMVRGKAGSEVEFGAKIVVSRINGYHVLEEVSWDNFNEATRLKGQIEGYRERMGCYPEAVLADRLYRNRDNIRFCSENGIRLSGPKLGRPGRHAQNERKIERRDSAMRNAIEGSFGVAKRRYGMNRIMMKLRCTSETSIALIVLVMNLERIVRNIFVRVIQWIFVVNRTGFLCKERAV